MTPTKDHTSGCITNYIYTMCKVQTNIQGTKKNLQLPILPMNNKYTYDYKCH